MASEGGKVPGTEDLTVRSRFGYLHYCKKRGFISCHIWSCAPRKGQDYLFYHHPGNQRTPTASKFTNWYQTMTQKAVEQKVVVSHSNMYVYHFHTSSGSRCQVSATRLPYFEGDSWFNFAEAILKKVDKESKSNHKRKRAKFGPKHNIIIHEYNGVLQQD